MNTDMINEEVIVEDVAERIGSEAISYNPNNSLKVMIGTGLFIATGAVTYKFAIKPLVKKVKNKIASRKSKEDIVDDEVDVSEEFDTVQE